MSKEKNLSNQVAIVTGAGKGLGKTYALHLATQGVKVLVNNRRHTGESDVETSAMKTVEEIRSNGGIAVANWDDVCDPLSGCRMVEQAQADLGDIDIVIANAGIDHPQSFSKMSIEAFQQIFTTSFYGNLHLIHACWPNLMKRQYGRVLLTSSGAGLYGNHGQAAYSAAKAAVIGLAKSLAIEGRNHGIAVNIIAPYAHSQMTAPYMEESISTLFRSEKVAPVLEWLVSSDCTISGQILETGGGGLRLARTGETRAANFGESVAGTIQQLQQESPRSFSSANDSFAALIEEIQGD